MGMKHWGRGFIACAFAIFVGGCDTPADGPRRAELKSQVELQLSQDTPLTSRLDLSRPAILEELQGSMDADRALPACNGYCLRLLYTGEAKVVLSGYVVDAEVLRRRNLTRETWPEAYGDSYILFAYHLEKRDLCPEADYRESETASSFTRTNRPMGEGAEHMAYLQIAAGNCLIGKPATVQEASTIITLTQTRWDGGDMWLTAYSVTAYVPNGLELDRRYRKTVAHATFRQAIAPSWWSPTTTVSDPRTGPDFLRQDLGLRLEDIPAADIDLGAKVGDLLADKAIEAKSPRWKILQDYLRRLAETKSLTPEDVEMLRRILADPRTTENLSYHLSDITRRHGEQAAPLAEPMLRIMAATARYGDPRDPALIAETRRFHSLAGAVSNLPSSVVAANQDLLVQVVSDPMQVRGTEYLLERLDDIDPQKAGPVLIQYIGGDSTPEASEAAMLAACRLGQRAPQLRPVVVAWIAAHPKTDRERRYRSTPIRQNAETFLAGKGGECRS